MLWIKKEPIKNCKFCNGECMLAKLKKEYQQLPVKYPTPATQEEAKLIITQMLLDIKARKNHEYISKFTLEYINLSNSLKSPVNKKDVKRYTHQVELENRIKMLSKNHRI
ncbi:hypothetical protein BB559_006674 [Furculomyces boomerangus]|uniref:Uncharacterized protein n=1 Tax=Furculomyces boomerangus TaxID=61424 RepID=A0A2T9Y1A5_9FUNG|nr:hypothetical protein BB559_006674 [Furculomyces boomerangus]